MSDGISMWGIPTWREEGCLHQTFLWHIAFHEPIVILVAHLVPRIS
jgi:hypothetical protein